MVYNVTFTKDEIFYLSNRKIVRNNLLVKKVDLTKKVEMSYDQNLSESKIMLNLGIYKIWDCGKIKFEFS